MAFMYMRIFVSMLQTNHVIKLKMEKEIMHTERVIIISLPTRIVDVNHQSFGRGLMAAPFLVKVSGSIRSPCSVQEL